jgi:hypothetical protein
MFVRLAAAVGGLALGGVLLVVAPTTASAGPGGPTSELIAVAGTARLYPSSNGQTRFVFNSSYCSLSEEGAPTTHCTIFATGTTTSWGGTTGQVTIRSTDGLVTFNETSGWGSVCGTGTEVDGGPPTPITVNGEWGTWPTGPNTIGVEAEFSVNDAVV